MKLGKQWKNLDQFLTLNLDQFLTLKPPNLGPVFNFTYIYIYIFFFSFIHVCLLFPVQSPQGKSQNIRKRHMTLKLAGPQLDAWCGARWLFLEQFEEQFQERVGFHLSVPNKLQSQKNRCVFKSQSAKSQVLPQKSQKNRQKIAKKIAEKSLRFLGAVLPQKSQKNRQKIAKKIAEKSLRFLGARFQNRSVFGTLRNFPWTGSSRSSQILGGFLSRVQTLSGPHATETQKTRKGCGCPKFLAGRFFGQISTLLENCSPIFRRTKCYPCQGLGNFRQGKWLLENWPRLRERCWIFSSETATAFLSSSEKHRIAKSACS